MRERPTRTVRLNRNGLSALCGWTTCNAEIGRVVTGPAIAPDELKQHGYAWARAQPDYPRLLCLQPGIARGEDGIWARTKHAEDNIRYGREPSFARPLVRPGSDYVPGVRYGLVPKNLPVTVKCPTCERLSVCGAPVLRVSSYFVMVNRRSEGIGYGSVAVSWEYGD